MGRRRPLRIAFGRIFQESNAFSPLATTIDDFRRAHWISDDALLAACGRRGVEIPGYVKRAELSGFLRAAERDGAVEAVPLCSIAALPSGQVAPEAFADLQAELLKRLSTAGPIDGLFLSLHGAMRIAGATEDAEGQLLKAIRARVGAELPIAVCYDLHANFTPAKADLATISCALRTNPHRDMYRVGQRTAELLIARLRSKFRPTRAWRKLPLVLGGGAGIDFLAPMRRIFLMARLFERLPRVRYVSLYMCHPWSDASDLGWAVDVLTDNDQVLAERLAERLAEMIWQVRDVPLPTLYTPREAIEKARAAKWARKAGHVALIDVADVPPAGGTGASTTMLAELIASPPKMTTYIPLCDPQAAVALSALAPGSAVSRAVGGSIDPDRHRPVTIEGRLLGVHDTKFGATVTVACGEVKLVITEKPPMTINPTFFSDVGLDPKRADVVIQKSLFHYRVYWWKTALRHVPFDGAGATSLDHLRGVQLAVPSYPLDQTISDWRAADKRLRKLA
ncbi:MAG: M81 family metallopeptidase [Deltaproteobacteria bacterium]|nr:M81 family metallopeptidase [Deltaproteobacteria bacterium]